MARSDHRASPLVLVTGGAGFIGSHTVDRLRARGAGVVVLDDFSVGRRENLASWADDPELEIVEADVAGDLTAPLAEVTRRRGAIEAIVHLAAQTAVARSVQDPLADLRINYAGTVQVLEYARRTGIRKIIFASSSAVYGDAVSLPAREDQATRPLSPYGINKLGSEHFLHYYREIWNINSMAFRFFNVYGPRQDPNSPYSGVISIFLRQAEAQEPLTILGDGEQTRDFVFVGEVARTVADACLADWAGARILNLGTGIETSINELARQILELTGARASLQHAPGRPGDLRRSVARIERAREALGFEPAVTLRDGLRATLDWMRGQP